MFMYSFILAFIGSFVNLVSFHFTWSIIPLTSSHFMFTAFALARTRWSCILMSAIIRSPAPTIKFRNELISSTD